MKLKLTKSFCWSIAESTERIVTMYFINGLPFTWDELTEDQEADASCKIAADAHRKGYRYTPEDLFRSSGYLIMEECHPCFFELDLENPELLSELED